MLLSLTALQQISYVNNRYIGEPGRFISDILDIFEKLSIDGYLVTIENVKDFCTLDYDFLRFVFYKMVLLMISLTGPKYYYLIRNLSSTVVAVLPLFLIRKRSTSR